MKSITGNKTAKNSAAAQILKISQTQQEAYDNTEVNNSASYSVQRERERERDRQTDRQTESVLFVGQRQTVQTQISRRRIRRLIRVSAV